MQTEQGTADVGSLKVRIRTALEGGAVLTSLQLNRIAHTVDSRKIISLLRQSGCDIDSRWTTDGKNRRFKLYYLKIGKN